MGIKILLTVTFGAIFGMVLGTVLGIVVGAPLTLMAIGAGVGATYMIVATGG